MAPIKYASLILARGDVRGNGSLSFHSPQSEDWYDNVYITNTVRVTASFCGLYFLYWVLTSFKKFRGDKCGVRRGRVHTDDSVEMTVSESDEPFQGLTVDIEAGYNATIRLPLRAHRPDNCITRQSRRIRTIAGQLDNYEHHIDQQAHTLNDRYSNTRVGEHVEVDIDLSSSVSTIED